MMHGVLTDPDGNPLNVSVALSNVITESDIPMDKMIQDMQDKIDSMQEQINQLTQAVSSLTNS